MNNHVCDMDLSKESETNSFSKDVLMESSSNVDKVMKNQTVTSNNLCNVQDTNLIFNELSKEFSNNLSNVEKLVKKLAMVDNTKGDSHTNPNVNMKELVKIRPLKIDEESYKEIERNEEKEVYYRRFSTEDDLQPVIDLITKDLSEPYSIYTYRYFIYNWPRMCIMAFTLDGKCIGAIVGKTESHSSTDRVRGYIAMLAVQKEYRRRLIGSRLVELVIDTMISDGCSEVVLETEITNKSALSLYEKLGFIRDKRLFRYYLNGVDAFRLKLWLS